MEKINFFENVMLSCLTATALQEQLPNQLLRTDRCKVKHQQLDVPAIEAYLAEETVFKTIFKLNWAIVSVYFCQLLREVIPLKPQPNPFHTYAVELRCKVRQIFLWPLIKAFIRDRLERSKENSVTFFFP